MGRETDRERNVLIYGINYAPEPTGVGRYTGELGQYFAGQGDRVEVITAPPHYPGWRIAEGYRNAFTHEDRNGVSVYRCPLLLRSDMTGIWRILAPLTFALSSAPLAFWRILRAHPDVLFCVEPTLLSAPIALLAARLAGTRSVLHVQDLEFDMAFAVGFLRGRLLQSVGAKIERFILRRFDRVVTISDRMKQKLVEKGVDAHRLSVVRNWVDLSKIRQLPDVSALRSEFAIPPGTRVALYAGNIGAKQALPLLLQAAQRLANVSDLIFLLVGDGPEKKRLMAEFGRLPNVRFLPPQPESRLCELLNLADIHLLPQEANAADLVLPSKVGGMLASGKACVVMADPGTELFEFLEGSAVLTPSGNVAAFANAILAVLETGSHGDTSRRTRLTEKLSADDNLRLMQNIVFQP